MKPVSGTVVDCGNGIVLERGRSMRTRDGLSLVSDHYYAPDGPPAPTLLMRQPYGRDIASTVVYAHPVWWARHGYNVVIQDVRGRGDSQGDFYPFRDDALDGYDTVEWAAQQPESNGKVGMYGFSYQGMTQWLAAVEQPPSLKALAPGMTAHDLYRGWFYQGGMFKLASGVTWGTQMLRFDALRRGLPKASELLERAWTTSAPHVAQAPYAGIQQLMDPALPSYFKDWIENDSAGPYWEALDISSRLNKITVPALHIAGWCDLYLQGSLDGYTEVQAHAGSALARQNQYLCIGPWQHIPWNRWLGELDLGPEAQIDTDEIHLRWFNHWLKESGEFTNHPRVKFFALGENAWHEATTWPPSEIKTRLLYLSSQGKANSNRGDGTLETVAPLTKTAPRDVVVVDPEVPVSAPGGGSAAPGLYRQNRIDAGNNVLVYRGDPFSEPFHLCGKPVASLYVSSSQPTFDLVVKLERLDGKGDAWNLSLGALRVKGASVDQPQVWEISMDDISCLFQAGDRVVLTVAGHAYPFLDRSSNRPDVPARWAAPGNWLRVTHQICHDCDHPSFLRLPYL